MDLVPLTQHANIDPNEPEFDIIGPLDLVEGMEPDFFVSPLNHKDLNAIPGLRTILKKRPTLAMDEGPQVWKKLSVSKLIVMNKPPNLTWGSRVQLCTIRSIRLPFTHYFIRLLPPNIQIYSNHS